MKSLLIFLFICSLVSYSHIFDSTYAAAVLDEEQVTFYPAYGYKEGDNWVIPMRVWVHERRSLAEKLLAKTAVSMGDLNPKEIDNFRLRIQDFVADSESHEVVTFTFDNDPENQVYRVQNGHENYPKTDLNGLVEGVIKIPATKASKL